MRYPYLNDQNFLKDFDKIRLKKQYAKITILNKNEQPIQDIIGVTIGGSVNLDGNSSSRRTANLNVFLPLSDNDIQNPQSVFSINKRVSIEIGFENNTCSYKDYKIIWFPIGVFLIVQANITSSLNGTNLSLQLKDKMCLLNGEVGGTLPAAIEFGEIESLTRDGERVISHPTLYQIIQEAVNHWGGEQLGKIFIQDLDTRIKKVIKWTGSTPLYCYKEVDKDGNTNGIAYTTIESVISSFDLVNTFHQLQEANKSSYIKFLTGADVGYIYTDFIYPNGNLLGNPGDSVCTILDQICNLLGNYEYFYDLDGNFIFREQKNYLNTSKSTIDIKDMNNNDYLFYPSANDSYYNFDSSMLITSYSNSPQYAKIKNDFIVWGQRETTEGRKVPIRYHLAIDEKPASGQSHLVFQYRDPEDKLLKAKAVLEFSSFKDLPRPGNPSIFYLVTGFSPLYVASNTDFKLKKIFDSDNKLLGNYDNHVIYYWDAKTKKYVEIPGAKTQNIISQDWRTELYLQGVDAEPYGISANDYYVELNNEWPKLYDIWKEPQQDFYPEIKNNPSNCDFFLDFIDSTAQISEFSIANIGRRTKAIVDDKVNCIFAPDIPNIVILPASSDPEIEAKREECLLHQQDFSQVDTSIYNAMAGGGHFNSAYDLIRGLLYEYTSYNESVSLQTIPIYHLDVNSRITVTDPASNIEGDYIIKTISIPLDLSSNMTISAIRAMEKF